MANTCQVKRQPKPIAALKSSFAILWMVRNRATFMSLFMGLACQSVEKKTLDCQPAVCANCKLVVRSCRTTPTHFPD
ncbi:hypothetical protein LY76DRAFT_33945 [Colletotrichum caudatum]|nr:hypothetical protein LY76DRAFT_33945 [Colletotrichum caudatum]